MLQQNFSYIWTHVFNVDLFSFLSQIELNLSGLHNNFNKGLTLKQAQALEVV